jgi:hypothetical protein
MLENVKEGETVDANDMMKVRIYSSIALRKGAVDTCVTLLLCRSYKVPAPVLYRKSPRWSRRKTMKTK